MEHVAGSLRRLADVLVDEIGDGVDKRAQALPGDARHGEKVDTALLGPPSAGIEVRADIELAERHDPRTGGEVFGVRGELVFEDVELAPVVIGLDIGRVEEDDEDAGTLDVAEELVPEALPPGCTLDEAGDVGKDELAVIERHDAEVGCERRERVIGDLRSRCGDPGDERALPSVGEADEGGVGDELQLERDPARGPVLTLLGEPGSTMGPGDECGITPASLAALGDDDPLAGADEVGEQRALLVANHRPERHGQDEVGPAPAVAQLALAVGSRLCTPVGLAGVGKQCRRLRARLDDNVAAAAPRAAHRLAPGLAAPPFEARDARAAVASLDVNSGLIDEHRAN